MSIYRKLVSVLLAALIPAATASALAMACPKGMGNMGAQGAEMAMMDMAPVQLAIAAVPSSLCCQLSPAEVAPAPIGASSTGEASVVLATETPVSPILDAAKVTPLSDHVPRASSPPQALLCVFLI